MLTHLPSLPLAPPKRPTWAALYGTFHRCTTITAQPHLRMQAAKRCRVHTISHKLNPDSSFTGPTPNNRLALHRHRRSPAHLYHDHAFFPHLIPSSCNCSYCCICVNMSPRKLRHQRSGSSSFVRLETATDTDVRYWS